MTDRKDTSDRARYTNPAGGQQTGVGGLGRGPGTAGTRTSGAPGRGSASPTGPGIGRFAARAGGWWGGDEARRAAEEMVEHEDHYREHFRAHRSGDLAYDDARDAYGLGHVAARHPEHRGRDFDEIESTLRENWTHDRHNYDTLRPFVREGYTRTSKGNPLA